METDIQQDLFNKPFEPHFDGETYEPEKDWRRLTSQLGRVYQCMKDGKWRGLREISEISGGSEASVSARLRDLRKERFGCHVVNRKRVCKGFFNYQLVIDGQNSSGQVETKG